MFALDVESDRKPGSQVIWTGAKDVDENYAHITYELKAAPGTTVLSVITDHLNGDEARRKDSEGSGIGCCPRLKCYWKPNSIRTTPMERIHTDLQEIPICEYRRVPIEPDGVWRPSSTSIYDVLHS